MTELYIFGSSLTDKFNNNSDIDLIVSLESTDPLEYGENYFKLKFELENLFNIPVDLLEQESIRNKTFDKLVSSNKKLIYARRNKSVA